MSTRPKILLVDDREDNLLALRVLLEGHEADLLEARSGDQALELLLEHEVALALVDVQMPEMDGFELAEVMRGSERTREVPLIFVTAGLHDQARSFEGYERGAVDFLVKPLEPHVVNGKVAVFLQLYRQRRQLAERVSELEAADEALRAAERRYRELVRFAPAAIYEIDFRARRFVSVNDAMCHLLGYSREELLELDPLGLLDDAGRARFLERMTGWLEGRAPSSQTEYRVRARDGRVLDVVLNATFSRGGDGRPLGATVVAHDVTERKRAERELLETREQLLRQEKLSLVGSLAGAVAHELRNPLGSIKNAAYLLTMQPPPGASAAAEAVQVLRAEVERAERIISSLLDFAWPRPPETRSVPALDLVREALDRSGVPAEVEVEREIEEGLEVVGDPNQLLQALGALVVNAVQAMAGRGRLTLRARRAEEQVVLEVEDDGPGIEEGQQGRLFEPLFTTKARGLGLGLAITKELVTRNRGTVEVTSARGEGARFTLRLPAVAPDRPEAELPPSSSRARR